MFEQLGRVSLNLTTIYTSTTKVETVKHNIKNQIHRIICILLFLYIYTKYIL